MTRSMTRRIAELEKENEKLKKANEKLKECLCEALEQKLIDFIYERQRVKNSASEMWAMLESSAENGNVNEKALLSMGELFKNHNQVVEQSFSQP